MTVTEQAADVSAVDLAGKRVLITSGTKGIGAAIAAQATQAGAEVLVAARTRSDGVGSARFVQADVSTSEGVSALAEAARTVMGGVDVLVDNVGNPTHPPAAAWDMSDEEGGEPRRRRSGWRRSCPPAVQQPPGGDQVLGAAQVQPGQVTEAVGPVADGVGMQGQAAGDLVDLLVALQENPHRLLHVGTEATIVGQRGEVVCLESAGDVGQAQHQR